MKVVTLLVFTLFMHTAVANETCDKSLASDSLNESYSDDSFDGGYEFSGELTASKEELLWSINLSKHLLKNDDININLIALSHLKFMLGNKQVAQMDEPVLTSKTQLAVLNKAIDSTFVTTPSLMTARSMCQEPDIRGQCDFERFNQKLFDQDPDNLNIYLFELERAYNDSDMNTIDILLQQMSRAQYSHMYNPLSVELSEAIDDYIEDNPMRDVDTVKSYEEVLMHHPELDVETLLKQNSLLSYLAVNYMNMPALSPLSRACQEFQKDLSQCQKIAHILIKHSDTLLMTSLGYGLAEKFEEVSGDIKSLTESEAASQAFKDYQMCIVQNHALGDHPSNIYDPKFTAIVTQGRHEGANLERAALYLFDKYKETHETAIDPRTCGLRYVDVEDLTGVKK